MNFFISLAWLTATIRVIDTITEKIGSIIAWLTLLMVLQTFLIVVLRYGFNIGWIAMQESVLYFHALVFMMGAAYTLKHDGHVRVDIFYQNFSPAKRALVNVFGGLFLLMPVCLFIFFICFDYVLSSWEIMEQSPEAGGLAFIYLNKTLLLLLPLTLLLQGCAEILRNILVLVDNKQKQTQATNMEQK